MIIAALVVIVLAARNARPVTAAGVAILVLIVWMARLLLIPYAPCWLCGGSGKNWFSSGKRHGDCWFCHGQRRRMVLGARTAHRIWNAWRSK